MFNFMADSAIELERPLLEGGFKSDLLHLFFGDMIMKPRLVTIALGLTALACICQTFAVLLPGWKYGRDRKGGIAYEKGVWYACAGWANCKYDLRMPLDGTRQSDIDVNTTGSTEVETEEMVYVVHPLAETLMLLVTQTTAFILLIVNTGLLAQLSAWQPRSSRMFNQQIKVAVGLNVAAGFLALAGILHEASYGAKLVDIFGYGMGLALSAALLSICSSVLVCFYDNFPDFDLYDKSEVAALSSI